MHHNLMSFKLTISAVKNVPLKERLNDVCPHWLNTNQQTNTQSKHILCQRQHD